MRFGLISALLTAALASSAVAQKPWEKFWLPYGISQGITEAEFEEKAAQNKLTVSYPLGDETKSIKFDDTEYWLNFCNGKLTYASWLIDTNDELIKSMNERINEQGFTLANMTVQSSYSDARKKDDNTLEMRLVHPAKAYSVTYNLYSANGQITVEDIAHDDSYGCEGDKG